MKSESNEGMDEQQQRLICLHHYDCGIALMRSNRHAQAVIEFEAALHIDPFNWFARWNRALALLALGNYEQGMREHDTMWQIYDWRPLAPRGDIDAVLKLPQWRGQRCRLLVYHQMGFGDAIMLARFVPEIAEHCDGVTLVVKPELVRLFSEFGAVAVVPELDGFDAQITLFNAVWTMGHNRSTIPHRPYLARPGDVAGNKMGIAWSGYSQRAFTLERFLSLLKPDPDIWQLYALQKGDVSFGVQPLHGADFRDLADLIATMDVIVTVDTAAAHLAGAIGHPNVHLVLPYLRDWRWWHKDVWYPTIKIYPQHEPSDWDTPFRKANEAIYRKEG